MILDLVKISQLCSEMEDSGKLDLSVVPLIDRVIRFAGQKERDVKKLTGSPDDSFVKYHAWRTISDIAASLEFRFENASKANDNPQVALDTLGVLPKLQGLAALVLSIENHKTDLKTRMIILDQVSQVRDCARQCNCLVGSKNENASVSRSFARDLARFVGRVETRLP